MTWTPHDATRENVETFLADVLACMRRTGKPFGKAAAYVFHYTVQPASPSRLVPIDDLV